MTAQLSSMSDRELADTVRAAELEPHSAASQELALFGLNEICGRLDLSLDETEQGLTQAASAKIDAWLESNETPAISEAQKQANAKSVLGW